MEESLCAIVRRTGKEVRFGLYCPRCGKAPSFRMHVISRYRWLEKLPHWRNVDCGSLKCACLNFLGQLIGHQLPLKTRIITK